MFRIYAICGQVAVGKNTLIKELMRRHDDEFMLVPSTTTRLLRKKELNENPVTKKHVSEEKFKQMIEGDEFIEWVVEHEEYYGKSRQDFDQALATGKHIILEIEMRGMLAIRKLYPEKLVSIFIVPPAREVLIERLRARGTEDEEALEIRYKSIEREEKYIKYYDYTVVNDVVERAVRELELIIFGKTDIKLPDVKNILS